VRYAVHENQLYPVHVQPVQGLLPEEKHLQLQLLQQVIHKIVDTPRFVLRNDAVFTISGVHNLQNLNVWIMENPHAAHHFLFQ
jgi:hypothetical protein